MEQIAEALKDFIIEKLPEYLEEMESEGITLPALSENDVVIGVIDVSRYENDVICSILPETQNDEEGHIADYSISNGFTVSFLCQNADYDVLVRRMCRYAAALRKALLNDYTINGNADDVEIGERKFYPDCGTVENQMTGVEIEITINTSEDINDED